MIAILIGLLCTVFTPNYFRPKTIVETYFTESVNGLSPGAPVKFKGIDIGKVTEISLILGPFCGFVPECIQMYMDVISKDTIDERVHDIVYSKKDTSDYLVDNKLDFKNNPNLVATLLGKDI